MTSPVSPSSFFLTLISVYAQASMLDVLDAKYSDINWDVLHTYNCLIDHDERRLYGLNVHVL